MPSQILLFFYGGQAGQAGRQAGYAHPKKTRLIQNGAFMRQSRNRTRTVPPPQGGTRGGPGGPTTHPKNTFETERKTCETDPRPDPGRTAPQAPRQGGARGGGGAKNTHTKKRTRPNAKPTRPHLARTWTAPPPPGGVRGSPGAQQRTQKTRPGPNGKPTRIHRNRNWTAPPAPAPPGFGPLAPGGQ